MRSFPKVSGETAVWKGDKPLPEIGVYTEQFYANFSEELRKGWM
jgi:hypothetical protein